VNNPLDGLAARPEKVPNAPGNPPGFAVNRRRRDYRKRARRLLLGLRKNRTGKNKLGIILMQVRKELRNEKV